MSKRQTTIINTLQTDLRVIPTPVRLNANPEYTGKGVTVAFLDSGFYPHPDLLNRVIAYRRSSRERRDLLSADPVESWQWHGTQTSVAAAGNGHLSDGVYRGLAHEAELVLVKVSERGHITEEQHRRRYSLGNCESRALQDSRTEYFSRWRRGCSVFEEHYRPGCRGGNQSRNRSCCGGGKLGSRGPAFYSAR